MIEIEIGWKLMMVCIIAIIGFTGKDLLQNIFRIPKNITEGLENGLGKLGFKIVRKDSWSNNVNQ